jgi:hypothetical protein
VHVEDQPDADDQQDADQKARPSAGRALVLAPLDLEGFPDLPPARLSTRRLSRGGLLLGLALSSLGLAGIAPGYGRVPTM